MTFSINLDITTPQPPAATLYLNRGGIYRVVLALTDEGVAVDLDGVGIRMLIGQHRDAGNRIELSNANGRIAYDEPTTLGTGIIAIERADTSGLNWKNGHYELYVTPSGGLESRINGGRLVLSPSLIDPAADA